MVALTIAILFFGLLAWLMFRFGVKQAETTLAKAQIVVGAAAMIVMVGISTLVMWGITTTERDIFGLTPINSNETFLPRADDAFVVIEGNISDSSLTKSGDYVAYLRVERGEDGESYADEPSSIDVDLIRGGTVSIDTAFSDRERFRHDFYNWPRVTEGFYTIYFLEHGTPVVVVGRPSGSAPNFNLYDTRMVYAGSYEEYEASVLASRPWVWFGWTITAIGAILLAWLIFKTLPLYVLVRSDDEFEWQQIWALMKAKSSA